MFFCKNCGTKIENDSAKFCPKCGQKFEPKQASSQSSAPNSNVLKNANASPSPVKTPENNVDLVKNNEGSRAESSIQNGAKEGISPKKPSGNNSSPSATPKAPKIPHQDGGKKGKGLLIAIIILAIILIAMGGTVFYLFKTGKLKKIEKKIYKVLHIKTKNKSEKHKHKHHGKSSKKNKKKNKKNKKNSKNKSNSTNSTNSSISSASKISAASAPTYVYANNNSNRHNQAGGFSEFKTYLSSASANITGVSPLGSSAGNAPAVIISNVAADGVSANPGSTINIHSTFYAETPSNPSSQSVKLTYEVYGNGLTAYNNSYVNVNKPGIYSVNLAVKIPSNFPAGTYTYVLTVTSTATIEESPAAYIKVQ